MVQRSLTLTTTYLLENVPTELTAAQIQELVDNFIAYKVFDKPSVSTDYGDIIIAGSDGVEAVLDGEPVRMTADEIAAAITSDRWTIASQ